MQNWATLGECRGKLLSHQPPREQADDDQQYDHDQAKPECQPPRPAVGCLVLPVLVLKLRIRLSTR